MEKYDVEVDERGTVRYFKKGTDQLHRLDGPAIEFANGTKSWYQNGELHRLVGPAVEYASGVNEWHIDDVKFIEAQFKRKINRLNTKEMTIAEIEKLLGHKVKIVN